MESEAIVSVNSLEILQERREEGERGKGGEGERKCEGRGSTWRGREWKGKGGGEGHTLPHGGRECSRTEDREHSVARYRP